MKPEVSAGCHQTLSRRWGLGTRLYLSGKKLISESITQCEVLYTDRDASYCEEWKVKLRQKDGKWKIEKDNHWDENDGKMWFVNDINICHGKTEEKEGFPTERIHTIFVLTMSFVHIGKYSAWTDTTTKAQTCSFSQEPLCVPTVGKTLTLLFVIQWIRPSLPIFFLFAYSYWSQTGQWETW